MWEDATIGSFSVDIKDKKISKLNRRWMHNKIRKVHLRSSKIIFHEVHTTRLFSYVTSITLLVDYDTKRWIILFSMFK